LALKIAAKAEDLGPTDPATKVEKPQSFVAKLYESHREEVYRYARSRGAPPHEAREISFLRLFLPLSREENIRNARAWVFTVAHNCAVHAVTANNREETITPSAETRTAAPGPTPVSIPPGRCMPLDRPFRPTSL
jgi:DNA-directed RNA polymerase specialized sigma24 family protein